MKNSRRKKSLTEVFGYSKRPRKLSINELRSIILEEEEKTNTSVKDKDDILAHAPEHFKNPEMMDTPADGTGSITDVPAEEIVAQMLSGDPKAPVIVAMSAFHNQDFTPEFSDSVGSKSGAKDLQKWTLEKGPAYIANNIATVQRSLEASTEGEPEVAAATPDIGLEDAVLPSAETSTSATWFEDQASTADTKKEAISRITLQLLEDSSKEEHPPAPSTTRQDPKDLALSFLAKGLKDGAEVGDDVTIDVSEDQSINVAEMVPTQQDVHIGKALAFAISGGFGPEDTGAYVTDSNEILDGHYRWSGTMIVDPGATIKGQKIAAPADDILPALTALGDAFSNSSKKSQKNENIYNRDDLIVERWQKLAGIIKG